MQTALVTCLGSFNSRVASSRFETLRTSFFTYSGSMRDNSSLICLIKSAGLSNWRPFAYTRRASTPPHTHTHVLYDVQIGDLGRPRQRFDVVGG